MIKNLIKLAVGLMMLVCVAVGYAGSPARMFEPECAANTLGGLLLVTDGILGLAKKRTAPAWLYLNAAVFLAAAAVTEVWLTVVYADLFEGLFLDGIYLFLRAVNPAAFIVCYMLAINEREREYKTVLASPLLTMLYLMAVMGVMMTEAACSAQSAAGGDVIYGGCSCPRGGAAFSWTMIYAFLCLPGLALFALNRLSHFRRTNASGKTGSETE